jgi:CheY-like chemotaxis protein
MTEIVLAEDDDDIRTVIAAFLRAAGYAVVPAADGAAALLAVRQHRPRLVISNIDMPMMTGIDLCLALRADPPTADLPVVFITGNPPSAGARPSAAQADAVLVKPFGRSELLDCVHTLLQTGHQKQKAATRC